MIPTQHSMRVVHTKYILVLILLALDTVLSVFVYQGWISDMGIDGSIFVPKSGFFTNLGQGLSQKVGFFLIFQQILRPGFLDKIGTLKHEIHLCLCFWLFWLLYFQNFVQILYERLLFYEKGILNHHNNYI